MKIGVKIGPQNWETILSTITPDCVEVWFRLDIADSFKPLFDALHIKKIPFGIHFWASVEGVYEPNLAYEKNGIAEKSRILMEETIDIAAKVGASYVNIHPGAQYLKKINFEQQSIQILKDQEVTKDNAVESLMQQALRLNEYAINKDILFIIETLPRCEADHWRNPEGRLHVQESGSIDVNNLLLLGKQGIALNNDFGHTISSYLDTDPIVLQNKLYEATIHMASFTRLIHMNTVCPPFNGTDSHNGILDEDFKSGVIPNKEHIEKLLSTFIKRDDVWVIPEPSIGMMIPNYFALKSLVEKLRKH